MSEVKNLFKNVSWVTISQVVVNICAFFWTVATARYLGVSDYGILSFAISFVVLLGMFADLGISSFTTRELSKYPDKTKKFINNIFPLKLILSLFLFILVNSILYIMGYNYIIIEVSSIMALEIIFLGLLGLLIIKLDQLVIWLLVYYC